MVKDSGGDALTDFDAIIGRLKDACGVGTDEEMATFIGLSRQNISQARKKGEIPPKWYITVSERTGCSLDWLVFGEVVKKTGIGACQPEHTSINQAGSEEWEILGKAYQIITSGSVYKSALLHNINAFYEALSYRKEVEQLKARLQVLERAERLRSEDNVNDCDAPKDNRMHRSNH